MPHECTACGRTFADGSKEMLSGCPDCGGTKFQFRPRAETGSGGAAAESAADPPADDPQVTGREWPMHGDEPSDERRTRGRVGSRAREAQSDGPPAPETGESPPPTESGPGDDGIVVADEEPVPEAGEDTAQVDARSGLAAPDEVVEGGASADPDDVTRDGAPTEGADAPPDSSSEETPDLSTLRKELNDQFESIKIVSPGQYELNLMELYEREEHIISLREDGRYVIEVPETWRNG
ncbi:MAG: Zn-ribbon domain-containing protein [Haloferacaceae archaeon]